MTISQVISTIEVFAPLALQEDYDNSGLQVGDKSVECTGALLCVDVTPVIVDEAINKGCNLIISHHPLIFKGLKRLTGRTLVEQTVLKAIKEGVAIYSCHTAIDNALNGVSWAMANRLNIQEIKTLDPQRGKLLKLSVYVPSEYCDAVKSAIFEAGAGCIGAYDCCSFDVDGRGSFRANSGANPFVGTLGEVHSEQETRIEVILPRWKMNAVEQALVSAHPYEEPAYEFVAIENATANIGSGVMGRLREPIMLSALISQIKSEFGSPIVRCNTSNVDVEISTIAMCGGSGSFLIKNAIAENVDVFLTSDVKYHDFVDYKNDIIIIDIGHFESEQCTKTIFYRIIQEKFPNFALYYSELEQNPINYL
ncbi:MAG: Nif3-like dinuclear metal center hexameric protein [Muribaculaceae bacterium]|nr:Nif3-like dinuclear metal center hexameric protein [Muribaculaceae bacterium]